MNYTLHQLHVFTKIVHHKSITKAAEELHMTQPAVSIQLKNFQDQFDIALTEVFGRQLFVTDFGMEIFQMAERILHEVQSINYKSQSFKGHLTGRLKISSVSTGKYIIPFFLANFLKDNKNVDLSLDVTNKSKVITHLANNEVDFALVSVLPDKLQVDKVDLMPNMLYVVGNAERKFKKAHYDKKIFNELPMIYREEGSGTRAVMERFIDKNKLPVYKKMELTSNEAVKQAVIAGLGYSIMPLIGIKNELMNKDLQIINVKGFPIKSTWHLIWLKNKSFSPAALAYLKNIESQKERIITEKFQWFNKFNL